MALQTLNNYSDDSSLVATDMIDELQQILMIYLTHWVIMGLSVCGFACGINPIFMVK